MEISNGITVAAPIDVVWRVLSDLPRYPDWNPTIRRADGRLEVGQQVTIHVGPGGATTWNCTVSHLQPGHGFAWRFHAGSPLLHRGEHAFSLAPVGSATTRLIDREVFRGLLIPVQARRLRRDVTPGMRLMDAALQRTAEAAART